MSERTTTSDRGEGRRGIAAEELRRHNLSAVLERIHLAGPVSRAELGERTGLNRSTIRDLLTELTELGLVVEDGVTDSPRPGRPSSVARARPTGAVVLAVELEVDYTAVATIGLGGHIFATAKRSNADPSPEAVVELVGDLGAPLLAGLPSGSHVVGVGAAAAGLVRRADGWLSVSPNRGWQDVPLGEMLAERLGAAHVLVANEADVSVLAEHRRGAATDLRNVIYLAGEVGLGAGLIQNGAPALGALGYSGEAGHMMINPDGRPCRCGSVGCWETEVGEEAFARHAGIEWDGQRQHLVDSLLRRAHDGDPQVFDAFREVGRWLGIGVGNLVNLFNPELIVFGGFYHPVFPFLQRSISDTARQVALDAPWESCRIGRSALGLDTRLIGAAEMILDDVIADPGSVARRRLRA